MEPSALREWTWQEPANPDAAIALIAHAFASDPFYRWLFPRASEPRRAAALERFFRALARGRRLRVTMDGARCLVAALDEPWHARPRWTTALRAGPALAWALAVGSWPRPWRLVTAARLLAALGRLRPKTPHLHLALVAVAPEARGTGLGKAAVEALIAESGGALHLETSRPENRGFYARLGMVETASVARGAAPPVWVYLSGVAPR